MPDFIKPDLDELSYRKKLLSNRRTMNFGTGTEDFDESLWDSWYDKWIECDPADRYFRLIYCNGCGYYVGETGYERAEDGSALIHLLIGADNRESGYGSSGLKHIASAALKNGMGTLSVRMHQTSPYFRYMKKRGFKPVVQEGDMILMKADSLEVSNGKIYEIDETCCSCRKQKENSDAAENS